MRCVYRDSVSEGGDERAASEISLGHSKGRKLRFCVPIGLDQRPGASAFPGPLPGEYQSPMSFGFALLV